MSGRCINAGHVLYIILVDQLFCTTLLWTLMACCNSCNLKSSAILHCLIMFELSLSGIWIVCYMLLAIWWTSTALYVAMVLRSTQLVSPALSSNISDSSLCGNLYYCNYSIKVLPSDVRTHKEDLLCHRLGGNKECRKTPCFGDAWWCDCMKTGVLTGGFLSVCPW